jgi:hypothetical protein
LPPSSTRCEYSNDDDDDDDDELELRPALKRKRAHDPEEFPTAPRKAARMDPLALIPVGVVFESDLREEIRDARDYPMDHESAAASAAAAGQATGIARQLLDTSDALSRTEKRPTRPSPLFAFIVRALTEGPELPGEFLAPLPPPLSAKQFERHGVVRAAKAALQSQDSLASLEEKLEAQGWAKIAHALLPVVRGESQYCLFTESTAFPTQTLCLIVGYRVLAPTSLLSFSWFLASSALE